MRTFEVFGPEPGSGWITVFWEPATTQRGRLQNIVIEDGTLHFELWNDWGKRPPYGPVVYQLTSTATLPRTGVDLPVVILAVSMILVGLSLHLGERGYFHRPRLSQF